jgi:hypothetical protein
VDPVASVDIGATDIVGMDIGATDIVGMVVGAVKRLLTNKTNSLDSEAREFVFCPIISVPGTVQCVQVGFPWQVARVSEHKKASEVEISRCFLRIKSKRLCVLTNY